MTGEGPRHERETIINFNDEEDTATVWTASEIVYKQMLKRGYVPDFDHERTAQFTVPKKSVKLPRKPAARRELSDEEKAAVAERFKKARESHENGVF